MKVPSIVAILLLTNSCKNSGEGISAIEIPKHLTQIKVDTARANQNFRDLLQYKSVAPVAFDEPGSLYGFTCGTSEVLEEMEFSLSEIDLSHLFRNIKLDLKLPDSLFKTIDSSKIENIVDSVILLPNIPNAEVSDTSGDATKN